MWTQEQVENAARRIKQWERWMRARRERGVAVAGSIAASLAADFSVDQVLLVGSLARPDSPVYPSTDIDLLVHGLSPDAYYRAGAVAERLTEGEFAVDLIPWEELDDRLLQRFLRQGVRLL
ncbi:MAG: nucleotidyltransferase domain-containing protein [Thermaerobacter sp.]|nr:nucleotidyltransferase domain-containing protein [Thermaerobacter sp.]